MHTIVISGAYSNIGKTTLANNIKHDLGDASVEIIKIGHNKAKPSKSTRLFNSCDEALEYINNLNNLDYLIIESNSILEFITPDLTIYLMNYAKPEKDSSLIAKKMADIIIDKDFDPNNAKVVTNLKLDNITISDALISQYNYMFAKGDI